MTYYEKLVKSMDRSMKAHPKSAMLMDVDTFEIVAKGRSLRELNRKAPGKKHNTIAFKKPDAKAAWIL